jgi:hypothetical protein
MANRNADNSTYFTKRLIASVVSSRKTYHEKTLAYCVLLNSLDESDFYEACVALVYTRFAYYHQGFEIIKDLLEPVYD